MHVLAPPASGIRTTCPYCGVGCGLIAQPDGGGGAAICGDPEHPANFGNLCSKGSALGETLTLGHRLLHPMLRRQDGTLGRVEWEEALDAVAAGFRRIIDRDGLGAVAFYLSGQLLTEDYYVANKLMKGFLGSANVDTNSRLCMASSVAGHRRAFGADIVPGVYADFDEADLIVLVGSNAAWCHPVLFQRMMRNKAERGARIVVIDPRRTVTAEEADLFLSIEPGTDTTLFCGLLVHIAENGVLDEDYIATHTSGFSVALARAREIAPDRASVAATTGLRESDITHFFQEFAATKRVVTCFSQGVNQSAQGTDKVNAIVNCHLAAGRIGRAGAGPFSLTGQPNAMGGREVGGLANQLAAHMDFSPQEIDRVRRFWKAPLIATHEGLKAVQMFEAIERGEIKALWVMATNPAVSLPSAGSVRGALSKLEFFVVSENVLSNDTVNAGAHVLLPAAAWGEKEGTVTNSERRISRQRAFLSAPGEAQPDWWIVSQVAKRLGFEQAFGYRSAAEIFREHAALSAFENGGKRDFDLGALAEISDDEFEALAPVQWPLRKGEEPRERRFFADGAFFTPDGKGHFIAPEPPALKEATSEVYPFRLNTGRVRDQWHTMTRTGLSARLSAHSPEPFVEIHPDDAQTAGVSDGGFARISTAQGLCVVKVVVSENQRRGSLFVPIHWSGETSSGACIGDLVAPFTDPYSGQPEAKATPAAVAPVLFAMSGFVRSRAPTVLPRRSWWARVATADGIEYRTATNDSTLVWHDFACRIGTGDVRFAEQLDANHYQAAAFTDGEIRACVFLAPAGGASRWDLQDLMASAMGEGVAQMPLLKEHFPAGQAIICACFQVGKDTICETIACGAATVKEIGERLGAGTNCGSCLPELKRLVRDAAFLNESRGS